ncbi:uncharacterized protein [Aegilops tauschii subsp. strangulata]|uniref:uncharacterized protein n=1 Tax=Aegilops tauschii subsp. strangulata TaxID=200361 RepID=UPI003CC88EE0
MIDLNEEPAKNNGDPFYCTQHAAGNAEFVAESPNPPIMQRVNAAATEAMETDGQSSRGGRAPGSTQVPPAVAAGSDAHTLDGTGAPGDTGGAVGNGLGAENDDEAWSQPKEPYVGMRFDTLEDAKEHYNAYSLQMGFSIKMNSARKDMKTGELVKQQFVCNNFRKPDVDDGGAEKIPVLDDIIEQAKDDNEDEAIVFLDDDSKGKKRSKKRKRDKIVQTGCKAKMIVKVIDGRWEVIYFVGEHNHPLVDKPCLTKYLRSHQGIPPEERAFLTHLHNCNLTTEKQAYGSYTRDLYEKFRDEFQLTTRYNVRPHGENLYEVYPNQEWVAKYGSRGYFVTVEASAGDYRCDCCKIERDGMLCCHILKVFNQLGVDEIPVQYILRRWIPMEIPNALPAVEEQPDEMPPQSKKELRHANLMMDFGSLARVASASDAATDIVKKHMRGARHEIRNLNMSKKKKPAAPTSGPSGGPPQSADGSAPALSNS